MLNALYPEPEHEGDEWYSWRVENWGTKWDVSSEGLEFEELPDGRAVIHGWFDSAWSPPIDAFQAYAEANEDVYLEIKYFEPGMSFVGVWDSEGGDAYWEDVGSLLETTAEEDDAMLDLLEHFNVYDWYDFDEDDKDDAAED